MQTFKVNFISSPIRACGITSDQLDRIRYHIDLINYHITFGLSNCIVFVLLGSSLCSLITDYTSILNYIMVFVLVVICAIVIKSDINCIKLNKQYKEKAIESIEEIESKLQEYHIDFDSAKPIERTENKE